MAKVYVCVRSKIMITRPFISCDHDGLTTLKTLNLQRFWQLDYILCDLCYNCWHRLPPWVFYCHLLVCVERCLLLLSSYVPNITILKAQSAVLKASSNYGLKHGKPVLL